MQAWSSNFLSGRIVVKSLDPLRNLIKILKSGSLNKNKQLKRESEVQKRENKKAVYKEIL